MGTATTIYAVGCCLINQAGLLLELRIQPASEPVETDDTELCLVYNDWPLGGKRTRRK